MGNSGSVHHMQSGLKELHTYYQVQSNDDDDAAASANDFSFLRDDPKFSDKSNAALLLQTSNNRLKELNYSTTKTSPSGVNSSHHIKVLPSLSENLRLRSTTNGAILLSGGTISGRRESLLLSQPPLLLERSRTFIDESSNDCMNRNPSGRMKTTIQQRRSQTQLDIDIRKRNPYKLPDENVNCKRFSSNIDLSKPSSMSNENIETYSNETYQKLSKAKIKTKKRKAPPVPPSSSEILPIIIDHHYHHSNDLERKQRLFKTKTETTANHFRQQSIKKSGERDEEISTVVVMRSNLNPGFRREKSFDAKLLSSGGMSRNSKQEQELKPTNLDTATKRKSLQIANTTTTTPIVLNKMEKTDFKMELEVATKYRYRSMTKTTEPSSSARQRDPSAEKRKLVSPPIIKANRLEIQSKIPQLKKTFYFGMESSKRKPLTTKIIANDSSRKIANSSSSLLDEKIITTNWLSSSKDHNEVYSLHHKNDSEITHHKIENDNGIQLNVRPTLPRRQLEIPRFSPVAAWRTLSVTDEQHHQNEQNPPHSTTSTSPSPTSLNAAIETANTFLIEDRIHRTYRDPCPFYPDNKSGDSGISGDDGYIVEKPIQPINLEHHVQNNFCHDLANFDSSYQVDELGVPSVKVVGPFLTAWTPQQDLEDEENSSSDGGDGEMAVNLIDSHHTPTSPHVFSLSLPRENQLAVYGEKNKMDFRSLQKLKRTTSSDLNGINGVCTQLTSDSQHHVLFGDNDASLGSNFRSDNWVLSKTAGMTTAITQLNDIKNCADRMDSSRHIIEGSSYFDMSVSVQPMSLGSLATGKHVMYLPHQTKPNKFKRSSVVPDGTAGIKPTSGILLNKYDNSLEDFFCKNIPTRNKRFSFQSSVRQIERRRLAEKLSKEADQKEALRKSELEAMRRVEEEFQRKRACEKALIRQQLRLYSMDDDNFMSLPNLNDYRAEPDGAVSSASELSPVLQTPTSKRKNL